MTRAIPAESGQTGRIPAPASGGGGLSFDPLLDLTDAITAAVAGGLDSDPDSEGASLTVATTTGTFDGETVPCNSFAWTAHASLNDGYNEGMHVSLGTIADYLPDFDPSIHGFRIVADLVDDAGGANSAVSPIIFVGTRDASIVTYRGAGWELENATGIVQRQTTSISPVANTPQSTDAPPWRLASIVLWADDTDVFRLISTVEIGGRGQANSVNYAPLPTNDIILFLGSDTATGGVLSTMKVRFRIGLITLGPNPLTLGVA